MLQPKFSVVLSPLAQRDFEDIQIYTLEKWGEAQRKKYAALIYDGLKKLTISPKFGHKHPNISLDHRIYRVGRHFAIYRIVRNEVQISRILHDKMDFQRHTKQ